MASKITAGGGIILQTPGMSVRRNMTLLSLLLLSQRENCQ
jgi:hypothetical protein